MYHLYMKYIYIKYYLAILVQESVRHGRIQNKVMIKVKFYIKNITLIRGNRFIVSVFLSDETK